MAPQVTSRFEPLLNFQFLNLFSFSSSVSINGVPVVQADTAASNGVIHTVDSPLPVPGPLTNALKEYSTLLALAQLAGLVLPYARLGPLPPKPVLMVPSTLNEQDSRHLVCANRRRIREPQAEISCRLWLPLHRKHQRISRRSQAQPPPSVR